MWTSHKDHYVLLMQQVKGHLYGLSHSAITGSLSNFLESKIGQDDST